jgi:hypothetical protein
MADPKTTAQLIADVRKRADLVGSLLVDDPEICEYLSAAAGELVDVLCTTLGESHFRTRFTLPAIAAGEGRFDFVASNYTQAMPWRLHRVDRLINGQYVPLERFNLSEITFDQTLRDWAQCVVRYDWTGTVLWFDVLNSKPEAVRIWYVPMPFVFDATLPGFTCPAQLMRWDRYLVVAAAAQCLDKQGASVDVLLREKDLIVAGIRAMGGPKDMGRPPRQVRRRFPDSGPRDEGDWW